MISNLYICIVWREKLQYGWGWQMQGSESETHSKSRPRSVRGSVDNQPSVQSVVVLFSLYALCSKESG